MGVWQLSENGTVPVWFVCLDGDTLAVLAESHYFNITNGPSSSSPKSTTESTISTSSIPRETGTGTSTITASTTGIVAGGTPPYSTKPATTTTPLTATLQSTQKLPKKAIAGISVGATIGGILLLVAMGFLARKYRIWDKSIFHNTFGGGQRTATVAELQADHSLGPTELPVNQEIKNSRVWVHPRGSGGLYEVP